MIKIKVDVNEGTSIEVEGTFGNLINELSNGVANVIIDLSSNGDKYDKEAAHALTKLITAGMPIFVDGLLASRVANGGEYNHALDHTTKIMGLCSDAAFSLPTDTENGAENETEEVECLEICNIEQ